MHTSINVIIIHSGHRAALQSILFTAYLQEVGGIGLPMLKLQDLQIVRCIKAIYGVTEIFEEAILH